MPEPTAGYVAGMRRHARIQHMLSDGQEVLIWMQARHPGRRVQLMIEWDIFDPVEVVGVRITLDDLPIDPEVSADALRAMRALGWSPPSEQLGTALMEPRWPEGMPAHRRMEVIRRIEEALGTS